MTSARGPTPRGDANGDQLLRRALAPLAGDPDADAARVLAAIRELPAPKSSSLPRPPHGWRWPTVVTLIASSAAAGFLVGFLLRPAPPPAATQQPIARPPSTTPTPVPPAPPDARLLVSYGKVTAAQARNANAAPLTIGDPLALGALLQTDERARAMVRTADGVEIFAARGTSFRLVKPTELELQNGRVLVYLPEKGFRFRIRHAQGFVDWDRLGVDVEAKGDELTVYSMTTGVVLSEPGGIQRQVPEMRIAGIADGVFRNVRYPDMDRMANLWPLDMIGVTARDDEIEKSVQTFLASGQRMRSPMVTQIALSRMGDRTFQPLVDYLRRPASGGESTRIVAARAVADFAERGDAIVLFDLLGDPDPIVRLTMAYALSRLFGWDETFDEAFWRDAPAETRAERAAEWRKKVLGK